MNMIVNDLTVDRIQLDNFMDELMRLGRNVGLTQVEFTSLTLVRNAHKEIKHIRELDGIDDTEDHNFNAVRETLTDELQQELVNQYS